MLMACVGVIPSLLRIASTRVYARADDGGGGHVHKCVLFVLSNKHGVGMHKNPAGVEARRAFGGAIFNVG